MITRTIAVAAALMLFAAPANAFYCPTMVKAIDAALAKVTLDAATKAEVMKLRDQGLAQHKAGNHEPAEDNLAKATKIILNNM